MHIDHVTLTANDPDAVAAWYGEHLGLPVTRDAEGATVTIGRSALTLRPGPSPEAGRAHHLAFSVPPSRFDEAVAWVGERTELITEEGSGVLAGPPQWNSRSVYFWGPDGADLELIARFDLAAEHEREHGPGNGDGDRAFGPRDLLDINEAALAVTDARATAAAIEEGTGLVPFVPVRDEFLPVGDQHGLLVLIDAERTILPTTSTRLATGPVEVRLRGPRDASIRPTPWSTVVARGGDDAYLGPNTAEVTAS